MAFQQGQGSSSDWVFVSRPGVHGKLQSHMYMCAIRQTTDTSEDGMTTSGSGYITGAENTWEICGVRYCLLVTKSFHLMPRMCLWHVMWNGCSLHQSFFNSVQVSAP